MKTLILFVLATLSQASRASEAKNQPPSLPYLMKVKTNGGTHLPLVSRLCVLFNDKILLVNGVGHAASRKTIQPFALSPVTYHDIEVAKAGHDPEMAINPGSAPLTIYNFVDQEIFKQTGRFNGRTIKWVGLQTVQNDSYLTPELVTLMDLECGF